ncbi:MAG: DegT/DnrJ/EryC1/StrS family aminotransferase [Eubacteriales bacterium]|nr:DegT/DnrJ/EryC1/StrS family aminotransferase [Eubacteriales bacterium]
MEDRIWVTRPAMPPLDEYIEEIRDIWDSRRLTNMGPKHEAFRGALCSYLGVAHTELLTNGHMALEMTMQAMKLAGEVITTPFTFASTTHAIVRSGLTPVFCDIDPENYTIDTAQLESLITERTSAIVPVHVYGNVCDVEAIDKIARKYGLKVIYDAAHAFGVTYQGKGIGSFGDASCFSFHATKVFHSVEGGAVCFREEALGKELHLLKNFGIFRPEHVDGIGANAKMNEFCAAMGLCNLRHIEDVIEQRGRVDALYHSYLEGIPGIKLPARQPGVKPNYAYFPIVLDETVCGASRDAVDAALREAGIFARKYFYPPTNALDCFHGAYDVNQTPVARKLSQSVLTLPLYAELEPPQVERICRIVLQCVTQSKKRSVT